MSRYILTKKMKKILEARGHKLVCKICECPLIAGLSRKEAEEHGQPELMGDEIESKQQRKGKCKFYHAKCYDESHMDIPNGEDNDDDNFFKSCPSSWGRKLLHRITEKLRGK